MDFLGGEEGMLSPDMCAPPCLCHNAHLEHGETALLAARG